MPRILFVSGFHPTTRARDLAYEFERFGRLVRCDVPAPRHGSTSSPYAFIEFRSERDAEDAYHDMHGRQFEGHRLSVQWAKNPPSSVWRYDREKGRRSSPPRERERKRSSRSRSPRRDKKEENGKEGSKDEGRRRSRSPRRDDRDRDEKRRSRSRDRGDRGDRGGERSDDRDRERDRDRDERRKRSVSPRGGKTPPRDVDDKKVVDDDRAHTPPFDN